MNFCKGIPFKKTKSFSKGIKYASDICFYFKLFFIFCLSPALFSYSQFSLTALVALALSLGDASVYLGKFFKSKVGSVNIVSVGNDLIHT